MISVVITVAGDNPARFENLMALLDCLSEQTFREFEIIVVEQEVTRNYWRDLLSEYPVQYHTIVGAPFNLSWNRNCGARLAQYDRVLFLDGDIVFNTVYLEKIAQCTSRYVVAWSTLLKLSKFGKVKYLEQRVIDVKWIEKDLRRTITYSANTGSYGGSVLIDKDFFFNSLGGYCENYTNWGGEDYDLYIRARVYNEPTDTIESTIIHLPHGGSKPAGELNAQTLKVSHTFPRQVSELMVQAKLGKLGGPTYIDFSKLSKQL